MPVRPDCPREIPPLGTHRRRRVGVEARVAQRQSGLVSTRPHREKQDFRRARGLRQLSGQAHLFSLSHRGVSRCRNRRSKQLSTIRSRRVGQQFDTETLSPLASSWASGAGQPGIWSSRSKERHAPGLPKGHTLEGTLAYYRRKRRKEVSIASIVSECVSGIEVYHTVRHGHPLTCGRPGPLSSACDLKLNQGLRRQPHSLLHLYAIVK